MRPGTTIAAGLLLVLVLRAPARSDEVIPHAQDRPPGPALSPQDAIARMTVPEGFAVELVAAEPDLVNPVAMTFDERGRIWVTESLEYPRKSSGPGRDRVKVLEDTDGDGAADAISIFAEGLNIPSGIAVGHGGVWVANAPDILFLQDTDGDGRADRSEVVVSGFGRDDTHELPNSLTWGPDGWLYGWNGVFNRSRVEHRGKTYDFTCAIFRIHPKTRQFELFCEGTSNPWGIAINPDGAFFASACVIDHLWHLVETAYYLRQGGPYPPFTWSLGSIVDHRHQKAAYCGIHYFDSPAYPEPFRDRLYMGNIHGNCINVDTLEAAGSSYRAHAAPDFLTANDAWFMPVVQKTGPDGCLYILDWYDRYHCYQDANRDPAGIDRLKGRLYRVRYEDTPRRVGFDLAKESDAHLIRLLGSPNVYDRDIAQRLLVERDRDANRPALEALVLDPSAPRKARMHALWVLLASGPLDRDFHLKLLAHADPHYRAWGVRAAGNQGKVDEAVREDVVGLGSDPSPVVLLQVAVAARKLDGADAVALLSEVLAHAGDDPTLPHIVWQNLHPLLGEEAGRFVALVEKADKAGGVADLLPRAIGRLLGEPEPDASAVASLLRSALASQDQSAIREALEAVAVKIRSREIPHDTLPGLRDSVARIVAEAARREPDGPLSRDYELFLASCGDARGLATARRLVRGDTDDALRLRALDVLLAAEPTDRLLPDIEVILTAPGSADFRGRLLGALGRLEGPHVAEVVLKAYPTLDPEVRPRAIELLTQRPAWARALIAAVERKQVEPSAVNVNQLRKLQAIKDPEVAAKVKATWGTVREGRNPQRELVVAQMRNFLRKTPGDPYAGVQVFKKVCAQCHALYGEGQDVGPDLTGVGRNDFDQLVSNVFDPSLVIGAAYQATIVATRDGRVLTGLLAEDTPEHVVLKLEGGKRETIARDAVEEMKLAAVSLMPEGLEHQIPPQDLADLFAFLGLDRPPTDPDARRLPGLPAPRPRAEADGPED